MSNIISLAIPYPDFKLNAVVQPDEFDDNNAAIVNKINEVITQVNATDNESDTHIARTDNPHSVTRAQLDTYSTTEIDDKDAVVNAKVVIAQFEIDAHEANLANPHGVTRAQLDTYSTAEVDSNLANKVDNTTHNALVDRVTTTENQIAGLNSTYAMDTELAAEVASLLAQINSGDVDVTSYIDTNFYNKASIDGMTLGSYKLATGLGNEIITADKNRVEILPNDLDGNPLIGFTATDLIFVRLNGIPMERNTDFIVVEDTSKFYIEKVVGNFTIADPDIPGDTADVITYEVLLNKRVLTPDDYADGSLINNLTISKDKLIQSLQDEITASTNGVATNASNITTNLNAIVQNTSDITDNANAITTKMTTTDYDPNNDGWKLRNNNGVFEYSLDNGVTYLPFGGDGVKQGSLGVEFLDGGYHYMYNNTDLLRKLPPFPGTLDDGTVIIMGNDGYLYVIGSSTDKFVFRCNPSDATPVWQNRTEPNIASYVTTKYCYFSAIAVGDKIYCFGGTGDTATLSAVLIYDTIANSWIWTGNSSLPYSANYPSVYYDSANGRIYNYYNSSACYLDLSDNSITFLNNPTGDANPFQGAPIFKTYDGSKYMTWYQAVATVQFFTDLDNVVTYTPPGGVDTRIDGQRARLAHPLGTHIMAFNLAENEDIGFIDTNTLIMATLHDGTSLPNQADIPRQSAIRGHYAYKFNSSDFLEASDTDYDHVFEIDLRQYFIPVCELKAGEKVTVYGGISFITPKERDDETFFDGYEYVKPNKEQTVVTGGTLYILSAQYTGLSEIQWRVR